MVLNMAKCLPTMPAPMITISNQCTEWAGPCTVRGAGRLPHIARRLAIPFLFFDVLITLIILSALLDGEISILVAFATKIVKQHP